MWQNHIRKLKNGACSRYLAVSSLDIVAWCKRTSFCRQQALIMWKPGRRMTRKTEKQTQLLLLSAFLFRFFYDKLNQFHTVSDCQLLIHVLCVFLTVFIEMTSSSAISALVYPLYKRRRTSHMSVSAVTGDHQNGWKLRYINRIIGA